MDKDGDEECVFTNTFLLNLRICKAKVKFN